MYVFTMVFPSVLYTLLVHCIISHLNPVIIPICGACSNLSLYSCLLLKNDTGVTYQKLSVQLFYLKALKSTWKACKDPGMGSHTYNPSTQETRVGRLRFLSILGCRARFCLTLHQSLSLNSLGSFHLGAFIMALYSEPVAPSVSFHCVLVGFSASNPSLVTLSENYNSPRTPLYPYFLLFFFLAQSGTS